MASELASELYVDEVLAGDGSILQVDRIGSVSALDEDEDASGLLSRKRLVRISTILQDLEF